MSIFGKIRGLWEKKSVATLEKEYRTFYAGAGLTARSYFGVSAALRAGMAISNGMGMTPFEFANAPRVDKLVNKSPNPLMTGVELREMLTMHAVYTGTGRGFVRRMDGTGRAYEIIPLHPGWCASGWRWNAQRAEYTLRVDIAEQGIHGEFTRDNILEISNPRWDILRGLDTTQTCASVLDLSGKIQSRQARLSAHDAPFGVLSLAEGTGKAATDKLKAGFSAKYGDQGIVVLDFAAKFDQLMQSPVDQQLLQTAEFQVAEIARVYGVHPYFLMQTAGSGAQGAVSDAMIFHRTFTMGPWIERWEAAIERTFGVVARADDQNILRPTPEKRAEIIARAMGSGGNDPWMTANEARAAFNLPPKEGGDELRKQDVATQVRPD